MLKASNNHFGDRSKIKLPKIREFVIQRVQKLLKILKNIFSINFGRYNMHKPFSKLHQMKEEIKRIYFAYIF